MEKEEVLLERRIMEVIIVKIVEKISENINIMRMAENQINHPKIRAIIKFLPEDEA